MKEKNNIKRKTSNKSKLTKKQKLLALATMPEIQTACGIMIAHMKIEKIKNFVYLSFEVDGELYSMQLIKHIQSKK